MHIYQHIYIQIYIIEVNFYFSIFLLYTFILICGLMRLCLISISYFISSSIFDCLDLLLFIRLKMKVTRIYAFSWITSSLGKRGRILFQMHANFTGFLCISWRGSMASHNLHKELILSCTHLQLINLLLILFWLY